MSSPNTSLMSNYSTSPTSPSVNALSAVSRDGRKRFVSIQNTYNKPSEGRYNIPMNIYLPKDITIDILYLPPDDMIGKVTKRN